MRLSWATDIHLNFLEDDQVRAFGRALLNQSPDAVLLAGDIAEADSLERYLHMLGLTVPAWFVLGNHDFYRGSIVEVRERMRSLQHPKWLPAHGVIALDDRTALVGADGWGDGRLGNFSGSKVELSDWIFIEELRLPPAERLAKLRALGDESARLLRAHLDAALAKFPRVIVLTHVPPFRESCWHEGKISNDEWLPWFTCAATGEVLLAAAEKHLHAKIDVYCGHTHGGGVARIRPNLTVHTGDAEYGAPELQAPIEL